MSTHLDQLIVRRAHGWSVGMLSPERMRMGVVCLGLAMFAAQRGRTADSYQQLWIEG